MVENIVVLGAGYAGLVAAKRVARRLPGTGARVTLVNATDRFVERIRLHQLAAGQRLRDLPLCELLAGTGVELLVGRVTGIDARARTITFDTTSGSAGGPPTIGYDTLVYALGSRADVGTVPGVAEYAGTVAEPADAVRLRSRARQIAANGGVLAVVGGGLTGIEAATGLAESHPGLRVELVTGTVAGDWLSPRAQRYLRRGFDRLGISVHSDTRVTEVRPDRLILAGGATLRTDGVVWAAGFRVHALAGAAGFAVDGRGRMIVDPTLRSLSHPEVYAAGDAAAARTADGAETRMSCQTGLPMGQHVADVVADRLTGRNPGPFRLRYVWQNISLGRRDAVTQFTHADDSPRRFVLTGRAAAAFKETIARGTLHAIRHPGPYRFGPSPGSGVPRPTPAG